ncbi:hypothetical protein MNBD_GAMMA01-1540 [hydrothermal vent metagenome]|uniref:Uncharacterized protein n=1 Tax=hydrothermal vent metagenome TaxID=652676 RepID=A0A3B0VTV0_9ZZZZ
MKTLIKISAMIIILTTIGIGISSQAYSFGMEMDCYHNGQLYASTSPITPSCKVQHDAIDSSPSLHKDKEPIECLLQERPRGGSSGFQ